MARTIMLDRTYAERNTGVPIGYGRLQKIEDPSQTIISYKYGNCRSYRVKIWAEELDYCAIGTELLNVSDLHLGILTG